METRHLHQPEYTGAGLRDIFSTLFKHKWKIIGTFVFIVTAVTIGSFLMAPKYEAKSSMLLKFGREYIYRPEVGEKGQGISPMISFNQTEIMNSEIEILMSRDLAETVISHVGLETLYPEIMKNPPEDVAPMELALAIFKKDLSSEGLKKSNVLEVTFQHRDPVKAADTVNLLVDFFREKHLQVYEDTRSGFLDKQVVFYEQKLKESEDQLEAFKQAHNVFSLEEQRNLLLTQLTELDTLEKDNMNRIEALRTKLASLKTEMENIYQNIDRYTETDRYRIIDDAKSTLLGLQLKEQKLSEKYTDNNRLLINVRNEITIIKNFLKEQEAQIKSNVKSGNIVYQEVEKEMIKTATELQSLEAKKSSLAGQIQEVQGTLRNLDLTDKELQKLNRGKELNEKNYKIYLNKFEEARITEDMNRSKIANISIIQKATVPVTPIKPKMTLNIFIGAVLGLIAGLGFAFTSERASQGLSTPEMVEKKLDLQVLTSVPHKG
ncbi:MAG: GumC family protein [Syntrophales bacterium]|jgi:uncharacterized protein involved in exopolysaccharide biosynthesis|nr:GumC family protein [Syntrophales bacterium]MDY0044510.1 GumC family protein [Syntrophales bacterium]